MCAGPLSSPIGEGLTTALRYVLAPYDYNGTVPPGYNFTATLNSNTVRPFTLSLRMSLFAEQLWEAS